METFYFIYALAAATGLVAAGLAGTAWAMWAGDPPRLGILHRLDLLTPLKVAALCLYGPLGVVRTGLWYLDYNPILAFAILAFGAGWSFLQGVFILTTFFGYT
jgi:hypothetical protein